MEKDQAVVGGLREPVELRPEPMAQEQVSRVPRVTQEHNLVPQGGQSANTSKTGGAK